MMRTIIGVTALLVSLSTRLEGGRTEQSTSETSTWYSSALQEDFTDTTNLSATSPFKSTSHAGKSSDGNMSNTTEWGDTLEMQTEFNNVSGYDESFTESLNDATMGSIQWKWRPIKWAWWQFLQITSSVLGVVGQMLVMLVIWQRRAMNRSTDTLIAALAMADFLTSIFILPLPVAVSVPSSFLGEIYCRLIYDGFFMWWAVGVSIYTLALISVERLIAVMYPIYFNRYFSRGKTSIAVVVVWLWVIILTLNLILTCTVDGVIHACALSFSPAVGQFLGIKVFLTYFIIPATIMILAQAVTAVILHRKSTKFMEGNVQKNRSNPSHNLLTAKNRVIKMLFVVVLIFIICWGPNTIAYFLFNFGFISRSFAFGKTNRILTLLAFYNSCLNPIVYTVRHPGFREAIRGLFTGSKIHGGALFESKSDRKVLPRGKKDAEDQI